MPKIVDHQQRRREIARVHQDGVAAHGFAATTYASMAAAAGVSVGTIQYYFADRDELLRFSFQDLLRARDARIDAVVLTGEADQQPIRDIIVNALREILPLDPTRSREYLVGQQLRLAATGHKVLRELARAADRGLLDRVQVAVDNGKKCGEVEPSARADVAAVRILCTAHGLAAHLALEEGDAFHREDHLDSVFDPVVATVFTGRCSHRNATDH